MAISDGYQSQLILGSKANEHNSAIGRTPPTVLHCDELDPVTLHAIAQDVKTAITALQVPGVFAGLSLRPGAGEAGAVLYREADRRNDWPEANNNRIAKVLLADASGKVTTTLQIPYVADAATDVSIATALANLLALYNFVHSYAEGAPRLTRVLRVTVTSS